MRPASTPPWTGSLEGAEVVTESKCLRCYRDARAACDCPEWCGDDDCAGPHVTEMERAGVKPRDRVRLTVEGEYGGTVEPFGYMINGSYVRPDNVTKIERLT